MAGRRYSKKGKPILLLKYLTVQNYNLLSARLHVAHWERCDWFYSTRSYRSRRGRPLIRTAVKPWDGRGHRGAESPVLAVPCLFCCFTTVLVRAYFFSRTASRYFCPANQEPPFRTGVASGAKQNAAECLCKPDDPPKSVAHNSIQLLDDREKITTSICLVWWGPKQQISTQMVPNR
jgi:hypothetical protein